MVVMVIVMMMVMVMVMLVMMTMVMVMVMVVTNQPEADEANLHVIHHLRFYQIRIKWINDKRSCPCC